MNGHQICHNCTASSFYFCHYKVIYTVLLVLVILDCLLKGAMKIEALRS